MPNNSWCSKKWMCNEGWCCLQRSCVSYCRSGRDIRSKRIKWWQEGVHSVTVGTDEQHPRGLGSLSTSATEMPTSECIFAAILAFSVGTLNRSTVTAGELVGRWASLRVTINSLFQVAHLNVPGAWCTEVLNKGKFIRWEGPLSQYDLYTISP